MKQKLSFILLSIICLLVSFYSQPVYASNYEFDPEFTIPNNDCIIRNFNSDIVVNKDSSLLITESLEVDCGNLPDKHGIFRTLPNRVKTPEDTFKTPIKLLSITDFDDNPIHYEASFDPFNHTKTWKIGDDDVTIQGTVEYKITYYVYNAIHTEYENFDEFFWNLNGNFWELPIESYTAQIRLPKEVTGKNTEINLYTGQLGVANDSSGAEYNWAHKHTLEVESTHSYLPGEGVTLSIATPKIFTPYNFSFWELYGQYFFLLIPLAVFYWCFKVWKKHGDDPNAKKTVVPEYDISNSLTPIQMGLLKTNGHFNNKFITAGIISLAVKEYITLEDITPSGFWKWLMPKDFNLTKIAEKNTKKPLGKAEAVLLNRLFLSGNEIKLSSLKNSFYKEIPDIKKAAIEDLDEHELIEKKGLTYQIVFFVLAGVCGFLFAFGFIFFPMAGVSLLLSALLFLVFAFIMPKRTEKGTDLAWKIQGFQMYMKTAEQHRVQFSEKENLFEKFLPYAMVFGLTKLWVKKMQHIYGEDYFRTHHPTWLVGTHIGSFNATAFTSSINSLSSSISSNVSAPSGSGGGGFSGGGGGGGGGGSW